MGMSRLERLLAGVAVVAIIAATTPALNAATDTPDAIQAGVPIPEPADIAPPTAADIEGTKAATTSTATVPAATPEPAKAAAEPAKPAEPVKAAEAPAPTPNDIIAGKIKDLLAAKTDRYFSSKKDRAGAEAFYTARNNAPVWVNAQAATDNAKALATYLSAPPMPKASTRPTTQFRASPPAWTPTRLPMPNSS